MSFARFCTVIACALSVLCAPAVAQAPTPPPAPPEPLKFSRAQPFDMQHIQLRLDVDVAGKRVGSQATLDLVAREAARVVRLDAAEFRVTAVRGGPADGALAPLDFSHDGRTLEVYLANEAAAGARLGLQIDYVVSNPTSGLHFFAPSDETPDAPLQVWSQGQSIDNRYWVPCFDHPNELQTTEIIATVDDKFTVLSNGTLVSRAPAEAAGKVTYHWKQDAPHVSYLMTLVVGEFAVETEMWNDKPLTYYAPPDRKADIRPTFQNTPRILEFFANVLGVPYPWDKYAQVCCHQFGGGMENTSATTLGESALLDERARLDGDMDDLIAHEAAHQWFGDLVTCADWAHLWINEGFASYFEALWDEHNKGAAEFAYNMSRKAAAALDGGREFPIVHRRYRSPDQQFDSRAYPKGAWVGHMLRRRVGDEQFFAALRRFLTEHRHKPVETSDLRKAFEDQTGRPFERFFYDWTERSGHPVVDLAFAWKPEQNAAEIRVKQTQDGEPFEFPLQLAIHVAGRENPELVLREITEKDVLIVAPLPERPVMLRVDPHQAVLMELVEHKGRDLWLEQLRRDPSPVGRLRALKELTGAMDDAARELALAALTDEFWAVREAAAELLGKLRGDSARDALLAGARSPDARTRTACIEALGGFTDDAGVREILAAALAAGDPSYRTEAATIAAYAKLAPEDAATRLPPLLERASHRDQIRAAVLRALGSLDSESALRTILEHTGAKFPPPTRNAAIDALETMIRRRGSQLPLADEVVRALSDCLDGPPRVSRQAAGTLGVLGKLAEPALPALRAKLDALKKGRARDALQKSIDAIASDAPPDDQLTALRGELEQLRRENRALTDRVQSLEAQRTQHDHEPTPTGAAP